jgi:hypothetical protein
MHFISTQTASSSASLQWTGLSPGYNNFMLVCNSIVTSASALFLLQMGEGAGPTWETANYQYEQPYDEANGNLTRATFPAMPRGSLSGVPTILRVM